MEKLYILKEFSSGTRRHCQRVINSKHSFLPRLQISSHSLITTKNMLSINEETFMVSTVIWRWLELQQHLQLQVSALIISDLHIPQIMMQQLSRHLFQLSAWYRRVFVNAVEGWDTTLMPESSVDQNSSHQVLEEIWLNSTPFIVMNQMDHQESRTANLQQITSNPVPLLPTPALWSQLSWLDLIIVPLIILMLKFALHIFQLNKTLDVFQIQAPFWFN